jgi:predicted HicB family RNase H-like nuclease
MTANRPQPVPNRALAVRIPAELHERVRQEAAARSLSINVFVTALIEHSLADLAPAKPLDIFQDRS